MKLVAAVILLLLTIATARGAPATILNLKSGFVRYEASFKTLGVGGQPVSAVNRNLIGKIVVSDSGSVEGGLVVPVAGFDSNNSKRDKDVANILEYEQHPAISVEVLDVSAADIASILNTERGEVGMRVRLTAAGGSHAYDIKVSFENIGSNTIRFTTGIEATFSDFGIPPPSLGWFFKTARDQLYLSGDLVFGLEQEKENRQ